MRKVTKGLLIAGFAALVMSACLAAQTVEICTGRGDARVCTELTTRAAFDSLAASHDSLRLVVAGLESRVAELEAGREPAPPPPADTAWIADVTSNNVLVRATWVDTAPHHDLVVRGDDRLNFGAVSSPYTFTVGRGTTDKTIDVAVDHWSAPPGTPGRRYGGRVDLATLTVPARGGGVPPPVHGSFGPGANEPGGMSAIVDESGCNKDWGPRWEYGTRWRTHVTVVQDAGSPTGCALEFLYETGKGDGFSGAAFLNDWGVRPDTMYMRFVVQFDPGWQQHTSGVTKLPFWGAGTGRGASASEFVAIYQNTTNLSVGDQSGTGEGGGWRVTSFDPRGRYIDVEILHFLGTPGQRDGWFRVWLDGVEHMMAQWHGGTRPGTSADGWQFLDPNEPWGFKGLQFGFYWGGCCNNRKSQDDWIRAAGLYVSGNH